MAETVGVVDPHDEHPYSVARAVSGETVFISGALGVDSDGSAVSGRCEALDAALERLAERLKQVGLGLMDLVKLTYFVTDISLREEANAQYVRVFDSPRPARSFIEVSGLPYGSSVEIDAIAAKQ